MFDAKARAENEEIDWRWEGRWASRETEHDKPWPWPRAEDCARWSGQVEFLQELQAAEARVGGARPWGKGFDSCRLCGAALPGLQYEDRRAAVRWIGGIDHYVEAHHVLPSTWFVEYVRHCAEKRSPEQNL